MRKQWYATASLLFSATLLGLVATLSAQEEIKLGKWQMTAGEIMPRKIAYAGQTIITKASYSGYKPAWKGTSFSLTNCQKTIEEMRVAWRKNLPAVQDCQFSAGFDTQGFCLKLQSKMMAEGPSEFSLTLKPEILQASDSHFAVMVDGKSLHLPVKGKPFERFNIARELIFQTPEGNYRFTCPHMQLQDRRAQGGGLFLVQCISNSKGKVRELSSEVRLQVEKISSELRAGRVKYLQQSIRTVRALPLANPDFENGLEGWHHSTLASIDKSIRHGGDASLKLTVSTPPKSRHEVYITQLLPVIPGAHYELSAWVKSENLHGIMIDGQAAIGATVLIEFADTQRKWLASGAYGKGYFGTHGWHKQTVDCIAPKGAAYAIAYLAMRCTGTAWFDDALFTEVNDHVVLISPLDGQTIEDNTPKFHWQYKEDTDAVVELSRSTDFSTPAHRQSVSSLSPISLREAIAPGIWFWRVVYDENHISPVWHFVQTAPLTQDCTPPSIDPAHAFLPEPFSTIRIPLHDQVGIAKCTATLDGKAITGRIKNDCFEYTPGTAWENGLHRLQLAVEDAAGNRDEKQIFFTHVKDLKKRQWLIGRGTICDGIPDFPLGMYGIRLQDMPVMKAAGFDLVHSYSWDGSGSLESAREYLDEAQKHGLRVFMGLYRKKLLIGDEEFVAERVGSLMTHPALYAWYLFDEPDLTHQYLAPDKLAKLYQLIKRIDPFHPVIVTCARDSAVPQYRESGDVYWTQVYGNTRFVAGRMPRNRASLKLATAHSAILHCYDRGSRAQPGDPKNDYNPANFKPDAETMRANAFMALTKNSSGLLWWWWGAGSTTFKTIREAPPVWEALQRTVADIRALRPDLTASGEVETQVFSPAEKVEVHVWEKKLENRILVIAVNRDEQACEVRISLKFARENAVGKERFSGKTVKLTGTGLSAKFPALGVQVYEFPVGQGK